LFKLSDLSTWAVQEYDDAMSEEKDKRRQWEYEEIEPNPYAGTYSEI